MKKFLIIQTAFLGDVVLATSLLEKLHHFYPESKIDFLLRKGNEGLFDKHPFLNKLYVWEKKKTKYRNLFKLIFEIRKQKYDFVINIQRFATTGLITSFSGGEIKIGFKKNPLSMFFNKKIEHKIGKVHEIDRNSALIEAITDDNRFLPKLYPTDEDYAKVNDYKRQKYVCIAHASVWFTKQFPADRWVELINKIDNDIKVFLIGGKEDYESGIKIAGKIKDKSVEVLAGHLSLLETSALMKDAMMNYVNDSAAMHIASSVNANVTAIYCSTVPEFGFGPLSDNSKVLEIKESLYCRPCGLHGYNKCPEGHFKCAYTIVVDI